MQTPHQASALLVAPDSRATPPIVAVTGGKGGVGKTVVAANLAILAARSGYRVLLADLDPGLGNIDVHLRIAPRRTIEDLAEGSCAPSTAIVEGPGGISVLAGRSSSTRLAEGDREFLAAVHDAVARAARGFDLVFCDTGAGIGPGVLETVRRADFALAVTTPDPAAVTDAYALCKVLTSRGNAMPRIVVNRARSRDDALRTGGRLAAVCEKFLGAKPALAGWIRDDRAIERSILEQRPCALTARGELLEDLRALTGAVLSELPARARKKVDSGSVARRLLADRP